MDTALGIDLHGLGGQQHSRGVARIDAHRGVQLALVQAHRNRIRIQDAARYARVNAELLERHAARSCALDIDHTVEFDRPYNIQQNGGLGSVYRLCHGQVVVQIDAIGLEFITDHGR